jgi:hypothetical protein
MGWPKGELSRIFPDVDLLQDHNSREEEYRAAMYEDVYRMRHAQWQMDQVAKKYLREAFDYNEETGEIEGIKDTDKVKQMFLEMDQYAREGLRDWTPDLHTKGNA